MKKIMIVDLHCHSHFSDGELTPLDLVQRAVDAGVDVLALTDHDTIAGLSEFQQAPRPSTLTLINGIELSATWKNKVIHVLGLNINPQDAALHELIVKHSTLRVERARQMAQLLDDVLGIKNAFQKVCDIANHYQVGRPHFAKLLIEEGVVSDMKTAFKRYLQRGRPLYVPMQWAGLDVVVSTIKHAGGEAVLAHPMKYKLTRTKLFELINLFKTSGGVGIEVISGDTTLVQINEMKAICQRFDLRASTGSDFHGPNSSYIALGRQRALPDSFLPIWQTWS